MGTGSRSTGFVPETPNSTIDVEFRIDTHELARRNIALFEKLADAQENIVATREDINDDGQTVIFPEPENPGKG